MGLANCPGVEAASAHHSGDTEFQEPVLLLSQVPL